MKLPKPFVLSVLLVLAIGAGSAMAGTVAISPDKDGTLIETPDGSKANGSGDSFFSGRTNQTNGSIRRALLTFDIAGHIPEGSDIMSVTLVLHHNGGNDADADLALHAALDDWGEGASRTSGGSGDASAPGDATWLYRFHDSADPAESPAWQTPGGDYEEQPSATTAVGGVGFYRWSSDLMLEDVQTWLNRPARNHGWVLVGNESEGGTSKRIASRESAEPRQRPLLIIEFLQRGGGNGRPRS